MVNVMQQVGGSLGLAILVTVYASATGGVAGRGRTDPAAVVHGMASAFRAATIFDVAALLVIIAAIGTRRRRAPR
jgi:hypothetical protein